jgi:hypothetical protein
MILSRYFHDLHGSYQAEIEDLRYDSEGNDVLQSRLAQKRRELSSIMPMIDCDPVLVATAFHGAFDFEPADAVLFEELLAREPGEFHPWLETAAGVGIAEWAEPMITQALGQEMGAEFLSTVLGLEYAFSRYSDPYVRDEAPDDDKDGDEDMRDETQEPGDDVRIDDYLEQHGFDRRGES